MIRTRLFILDSDCDILSQLIERRILIIMATTTKKLPTNKKTVKVKEDKKTKKTITKKEKKTVKKTVASAKKLVTKKATVKKVVAQDAKKVITKVAEKKPVSTEKKVIVKAPDKKMEKSGPKPQTMAELLAMTGYASAVPQLGKKIEGVIIEKTPKMVKLDINAKCFGVIAEQEFDFAQDYIEELKVGDKIEATVISIENNRGQILLSLKGAANDAKWEFFEDAFNNETTLEAKGIEANKGGLIAVVNGVQGFVPSSQFSRRYLDHIDDLKDKKFEVRAIEVDRERNRLIFSERHVSEEKQIGQQQQALSAVKEGNVYEGVISGVKGFGLFMTVEVPINGSDLKEKVEDGELNPEHRAKNDLPAEGIGYVEGLIHISEISWEKVDHPKNYHRVGDRVLVKVLGIDQKSGKLNLSIKRLKKDPWQKVAEDYLPGTTFTGKVSRIETFGAFVDVLPGVDGLIHVSKLNPDSKLKIGDDVTVNVDSVDAEKRRMSLSLVMTEMPVGYK